MSGEVENAVMITRMPRRFDIGDEVVALGIYRGRVTRYHTSDGREPQYGVRICDEGGLKHISFFEGELRAAPYISRYIMPALPIGAAIMINEELDDVDAAS